MRANRLIAWKKYDDYLELNTDGPKFKIVFVTDDIIRMRAVFADSFAAEASYTLMLTAWEDRMDGMFHGERKRVRPAIFNVHEEQDVLVLQGSKLTLRIKKEPFAFSVYDQEGLVHADVEGKSWLADENGTRFHYSYAHTHEAFYGFGEKTGMLNKFKRRMRMSNKDALGYDAECSDPLYKHIPFYIKFDRETRKASGMFYHNSCDSTFDVGQERSGYWPRYSYFAAEGGELDLFFIAGPTISKVVERYTDLTGKTALPPLYALGYLGSTMYYTELPEDSDQAILEFADRCDREDLPCDGFHLSSGYTTGEKDGKRYVFNWNYRRFREPQAFIRKMEEKGVSLCPNIKPGMLTTNPNYQAFLQNRCFITDSRKEEAYTCRYWGGDASFVDFTNPTARELWKSCMQEKLLDFGIRAIWNDNCEYELEDYQTRCCGDGVVATIGELRPVMPNIMAYIAWHALKETGVRPFVVNRAGFAGLQRYASTWSGDNLTEWKTVKYNISTMLGMGLSGVANQGSDIGGFYGTAPEPELLVRWIQSGVFQPRFSIHSCNTDNTVTEPWMYPGYTQYIRQAIHLRYELTPYLYAYFHEAHSSGAPIARALVYEFPHDRRVDEESFTYMYGKFLLVAAVTEKGEREKSVYLPEGCEWLDWWTGSRYVGGQTVTVAAGLDRIPLFIRAGAIIPMCRGLKSLHHSDWKKLNIVIEPTVSSEFVLYEDDGASCDHMNGVYKKTKISLLPQGEQVKISFDSEGNYSGNHDTAELELISKEKAPLEVLISGRKLNRYLWQDKYQQAESGWYYEAESRRAFIKYRLPAEKYEVDVNFAEGDLVGMQTETETEE